jgi:protein-S-isoprenylcysteine O-methyltransferase Ste14
VFARDGLKRRLAALISPRHQRPLYIWIASALLFALCYYWQPLAWPTLYARDGLAGWLHAALQLTGLLLMVRSARRLDLKGFAGLPGPGQEKAVLKVAPPYTWLRHPLYLGLLLILFGTPRMTADRLVFAAFMLVYILIAIPWEEHDMLEAFGPTYEQYRAAVRWRLVPGVY